MSLKRRQWNNLLEAFENGSCIVLLGPMISTVSESGKSLLEQFAENLSKELEEEEINYDQDHKGNLTYIMQRFMTIDGVTASDPGFEAKKFFEKHGESVNSVQKAIAALPVSLVINTSPDNGIVQALKQAGKYKTVHAWYNYRKELYPDIETPSAEAPLVYNLFGFYKDPQSLVLTESNQVQFMSNVVKDQPPLPPKLLRQFDSFKTYLFLGFDWDQWNLRLLLESLNLEKESNIIGHSRMSVGPRNTTKDFYESSFRFSFITENIVDFIGELKSRYAAHAGTEVQSKRVFIAAVEKDHSFREELCKNLKPLPLEIWHDGMVEFGTETDVAIKENLNQSDLVLLLISADLLASDEFQKREWPIILDRSNNKMSKVIPIITRPSNWEQKKELTQMPLILPRQGNEIGKAISTWKNTDDALKNIVQHVQGLL